MLNSLNGRTVGDPNRLKVESVKDLLLQKLENTEKISFFDNMITENLSPKGKDFKMTMKMIISSTSSLGKKVDKILDFFESVPDIYYYLSDFLRSYGS